MDFLKDLNNSLKDLTFCLQNRIFDLAVEDTFVRQNKNKMTFILYCSHLFVSLLQNQQSHEIQSQERDQAEVTNLWEI